MERARLQCQYEDELLIQNAKIYADTANSCINTIILQLNQALAESDLDQDGYPSMHTATQMKLYNCLLNSFSMFHDAEEVVILFDNGVCFYQEKSSTHGMYNGEAKLAEKLDEIGIRRQGTWICYDLPGIWEADGLYCVKPYTDVESGEEKGYVILKVHDFVAFHSEDLTHRRIYLFGSDGMLLRTNDEERWELLQAAEGYEERLQVSGKITAGLTAEKSNLEIYSEKTFVGGMRIVAVTSQASIINSLDRTITVLFVVFVVVLLVMFVAVGQSVARAVSPIRLLSEHMLQVTEELSEHMLRAPREPSEPTQCVAKQAVQDMGLLFETQQNCTEIGVLIDSYNHMTQENRRLMEQLLEGAKREKRLELSLLQAQIKPHFLYNTLDTIYCLNAVGRYAEASMVVKLLSEYYRLALNRGAERTTLTNELDMVRLYLEIQKVRFKKILSFSVECAQDVPTLHIPKLLLQPLVENAIEHGIKPAGRPGQVRVCAAYQMGAVEIRVQDDGVGFDPEQFRRIIGQEDVPDEGYGVKNVAERLRLLYGERCLFTLEDREEGTSILIRIVEHSGREEKHVQDFVSR